MKISDENGMANRVKCKGTRGVIKDVFVKTSVLLCLSTHVTNRLR